MNQLKEFPGLLEIASKSLAGVFILFSPFSAKVFSSLSLKNIFSFVFVALRVMFFTPPGTSVSKLTRNCLPFIEIGGNL